MLPYIGQEIVETLRSFAIARPTTETSQAASQSPPACKGQDRLTPSRRVPFRLRSMIVAVVTSKWMIYLLLICL
jgi:hypothetical protein